MTDTNSPAASRVSGETAGSDFRLSPAGLFWFGVIVALAVLILLGNQRTVTGAYRSAAVAWTQGEPIYQGKGVGFLYLPQAAILFVPFTWLPDALGEILWRCLTVGCFAIGFARLAALAGPMSRAQFLGLSVVVALLSADCLRNGQSTLLMGGLMMLAMVDLRHERFGRAALWLSLSLAVKPLSIVLLLLVAGLYAPMRWRLAVGVLAIGLAPFLTQEPTYVWQQYQGARNEMRVAAALGDTADWASLFGSFRAFGLDVPADWKLAANLAAAVIFLGLAGWTKKYFPATSTCLFLFALSACYILLFNPRTENNTYALMAPALALSWFENRHSLRWFAYLSIALGLLCCYPLCKFLLPSVAPVWLAPWCGVGYLSLLLLDLRRRASFSLFATASQVA